MGLGGWGKIEGFGVLRLVARLLAQDDGGGGGDRLGLGFRDKGVFCLRASSPRMTACRTKSGWSGFVGWDGAAFIGEIFGEGVAWEGAEAGDYRFGVEDGSGHGGVGVGVAEEWVDGGGAEGVVAAGDDFVEVDEADVLGGGDLLSPELVGVGLAADVVVDPDFTGDERAEDGGGAFGADVGDVLAQVPAVSVYGFDLAGAGVSDVEGLFANAWEAPADVGPAWGAWGCRGAGVRIFIGGGVRCGGGWCARVGDGSGSGEVDTAVIVAPLNEDEVAGLDEGEGVIPVAGGDVGVAGESADGAVDDVDFDGVEEVRDGRSPAPEAVGAQAVAVADSGIADEDERGERGVGGAGEAEAFFLGSGVGRGSGGRGRSGGLRG